MHLMENSLQFIEALINITVILPMKSLSLKVEKYALGNNLVNISGAASTVSQTSLGPKPMITCSLTFSLFSPPFLFLSLLSPTPLSIRYWGSLENAEERVTQGLSSVRMSCRVLGVQFRVGSWGDF